jgi:phosphomannomutase/phosphoglucomutase
MQRLFSILTITAVLMILTAGLGVYLTSTVVITKAKEDAALASANGVSLSLSKQIQQFENALDKMAQLPEVVNAVSTNDATALQMAAANLEKYIPAAKKIRLFPVGIIELDASGSPKMGYGDLDMVKATFQDNPLPAIQGDIGPDRHLAITRKITKANQTIGVILASLDFDFISQTVNDGIFDNNYLEIKQDKLVISSAGEKDDSDSDFKSLNVNKTHWKLNYVDPNSSSLGLASIIFSFILIPILVTAGIFFVSYRQIKITIDQDLEWILHAFRDILANRPKGSYPVTLDGMNYVIASMIRFNKDVESKGIEAVLNKNDDFELEGFFEDMATTQPENPTSADTPTMPMMSDDLAAMVVEEIPPVDETVVATIEKSNEPSSLITDAYAAIFRAYDIRGIVGDTLTKEIVYDIGRALGSEAKASSCHNMVIGRDGRISSPTLAAALSEGVASTGCHVIDIGMVPTPVLYFVVQHTDGRSGVMITGSHNPAEYNGLKMMIKGDTLSGQRIQLLKDRIDHQNFISGKQGSIEQNEMFINEYIGTLCDDIQVTRPLKVVVDCGNGVAGNIAPTLLNNLGCEVIELFCDIDGHFPNHHPDPSKPENMLDLIKAVKENQADLGIAFDGDGDRLGVVDSKGNIIWPDRQMMLFAKDVLAGKPGSEIIFDVKCSRHLPDQIVKFGGRPLMWKTGHSFMKAKLKETGARLAGEMSGHIFFNDRWFGFDDALYSAARLLQILSEDTRKSADVFSDFPDSLSTPELNVALEEGENIKFIEDMFANAKFSSGKVTDIDGMRMDFSDGWGLVRASNTTPSLVIRFEADNQEAMYKIQNQFRELMVKVKPDIKLPF